MTDTEQKRAAKRFADKWKNQGYEKGQSQPFWLSLLRDVYDVQHPEEFISFEEQVHLDHTSFIDGTIPATKVLIEQKGLNKDLDKPIKQSDGTFLTPFQQAKRYITELPLSQHPRWVVTCNFAEFHVYDMERPGGEPEKILLSDLEKDYYRLQFLVDTGNDNLKREMEISIAAGEIVGLLYDAFLKQYKDPASKSTLRSLNILCVRLVFCLYAEDAGVFGKHGMFHDYLAQFDTKHLRRALIELFHVLDTVPDARDPYMEPELSAFPYVNGGLFQNEDIEIPMFTDEIRDLLLVKASEDFDWSEISPTIFGAVFESTLNPETRRSGGMHYTSIENIHKVIDPLFLNSLREELDSILARPKGDSWRSRYLRSFQDKLAGLSFLDPACGSGNFLTETYLSLRRMENEIIREFYQGVEGQISFGGIIDNEYLGIKVSISQFYGIEINDFAVTVAKTALWIAESQMIRETESIVHMSLDFLPLKTNAHIVVGNALRIDWESVAPKDTLNFIMGNPPFSGARLMGKTQKDDVQYIFEGWKNVGALDYVSCWFKKARDTMAGTQIRTALVSTNSITQGEQVPVLWKPLFEQGVHIDFAYRTFRWDSEASIKAHVHCVIVGFSTAPNSAPKKIFSSGRFEIVDHINAYLMGADDIFVESRSTPITPGVPAARSGNKPIDNGYYLFTESEKDEFIKSEPASEKWFRPWYGSEEFINRKQRYCLWLGDCPLAELSKMPECLKRVEAVRKFRLSSSSSGTVKLADKPTRFHVETLPESDFLILPLTSSETRRYVPIGFMPPNVMASNLVIVVPNAGIYEFGVLTSSVFMSWMRAVCGRLKSDYRITKDNVYNPFPWPTPSPKQKARIEKTGQAILDARDLEPDVSLAILYKEATMPYPLRKAHQDNDKAVLEAYGLPSDTPEQEIVAFLMERYRILTDQ